MTFCYPCRKDVEYIENKVQRTCTVKGEAFSYFGFEARCQCCQGELSVEYVDNKDLLAFNHVYRERKELVSLETVKKIPGLYNISQKNLSKLLGWGESTFSRFYKGELPSRQYSERLTEISENPEVYYQLLEKGREKIPEKSYQKTEVAVELLLQNRKEWKISERLENTVRYFLAKTDEITPLALQKLVYYVQGFSVALYGDYFFEEDCQAWVHGPVYPYLYQKFKRYQYAEIHRGNTEETEFTSNETALLDAVLGHFSCYSGKVLEWFTHQEDPWLSTRGNMPEEFSSQKVISKESIATYFSQVKDKQNIREPEDIKKYSSHLFESFQG